ncbi:MAG: hypothetical protein IJV37_00465 [Bacteroidales bacterium]|nr:hypothetical protein [Bacteroidales bacterium]
MIRKWIHRALKGASLTTALFVFQACYGTPPDRIDHPAPPEEQAQWAAQEQDAPEEVVPEEGREAASEKQSGTDAAE